MSNSLDRLLRLRAQLEEISRLELDVRLQELAQTEAWMEALSQSRKQSREESFTGIEQAKDTARVEAETVGSLACWQQERLIPLHKKQQEAVEEVRAKYRERRGEFRQMEIVTEAREAERKTLRNRREQKMLDEWFARRGRNFRQ